MRPVSIPARTAGAIRVGDWGLGIGDWGFARVPLLACPAVPGARLGKPTVAPRSRAGGSGAGPRGMVLIVVLVAVALLTLAAAGYTQWMLAERAAAREAARRAQARASAESGIEALRWFLAMPPELQQQQGGWYDNPALLAGSLVVDDADDVERSRFAVVAPLLQRDQVVGLRFGLEDESARLNLAALETLLAGQEAGGRSATSGGAPSAIGDLVDAVREAGGDLGGALGGAGGNGENGADDDAAPATERDILMALPGMTEWIADAILDFIDEDDQPRELGAESEYYSALEPPYRPKNGPLDSIEELLLVRDLPPQLLFGADVNFNSFVDPDEIDPMMLEGVDPSAGAMDRGWAAYLTLDSRESNLAPDGAAKIDLNDNDLETLYADLEDVLGAEWATFIVAYRQHGPYTPAADETLSASPAGSVELDFSQAGQNRLTSVLDLVGVLVQVPPRAEEQAENEEAQPTILESPLMDPQADSGDVLGTLLDYTAIDTSETIVGRVNVNLAPPVVLRAVPGMTPDLVEGVLARRVENPVVRPIHHRHATWLLVEGVVGLEEMKRLLPRLCGAGSVYRAQVVGYFDRAGPAIRLEILLDTSVQPPKLLRVRDLTPLGRGYPPEVLGIEGHGGL
jgi:hypothetical protein